ITSPAPAVKSVYEANRPSFNLAEPAVHMAQILVTPYPDSNVHNLKNSKAQNDKEARTKIEDIAGRLKNGEDFGMLAQNYSEDPNGSQANGGGMGVVEESDLDKASPGVRQNVVSLPDKSALPDL